MIKIAFTTLSYNYGSLLQCYATKRLFEKHGAKCDYFSYFSYLPKWYRFLNNNKFKKQSNKPEPYFLDEKFKKFKQDFINYEILPRHYSYKTLRKLNTYYDHFLIGSDQVWNFNQGMSFLPFLPFSKKNQCSSFASSFGNSNLGCSERLLRNALKKFKYLSVREESGAELIKKATGRDAEVLPDPVVALTSDEWRSFYSNRASHFGSEEYILIHFLNKPSNHALTLIKNKLCGDKIKAICFFGDYGYFDDVDNVEYIEGSPYDYLYLIDNAKFVLTDSFHTAQFSVIFNKQFYIFERDYGAIIPQNDRIQELIKKFNLFNCYIDNTKENFGDNQKIDVSLLTFWREKIHNYASKLINNINQKDKIADSFECCNCGSCLNSCPSKAIYTTRVPASINHKVINLSKCCNCNLCSNRCFMRVGTINKHSKHAYYGFCNNIEIRRISASGGVFASLAQHVIENGGFVYGASLEFINKKAICKTVCVDKVEDLRKILNSKYVECDLEQCMQDIKKKLDGGKIVLVGSTSCKINGLLNFLNKNYKNLYTVDFVCHGVPSTNFFNKYLKFLERKFKGKIIDYSFKKKPDVVANVEWYDFYSENIVFKKRNKIFTKTIAYKDSWYLKKYAGGQIYRDNCYFCDYASTNKPSDLTLGDYFELKYDYPDNKQSEKIISSGVNAIIVNSPKGKDLLLSDKDLTLSECSLTKLVNSHYNLRRSFDYDCYNAKMRKFVSRFGLNAYFKVRRIYDIVHKVIK